MITRHELDMNFKRAVIRKLEELGARFDYLEKMANKNEYEFAELKKELFERLDEIDAGISAIEEQIEDGVLKEADNNGYLRGLEHAQKIIDKTFKK